MATNVNDHYKTALNCALCKDILTDPRTLPCLHSYCLKCLHSLVEKSGLEGGSFNCPECRDLCNVPQQGVGEFKVSPTITFLLDAYKDSNQTQEPDCSTCLDNYEKNTPARIRCLDCNKRFCASCRKMHDTFLQGHKVLDLIGDSANDLQTAFQMVKERTVYCKIHPTKPIEYFCKADKTILCQSCFTINHSGHPCEDINETAAKNVKHIGAAITQGKQLVDAYEQAIQNTQADKSKFESKTENVLAEINNDMIVLKEAVDAKYKSFKEQVVKEKQTYVKQVMSHIGHLELNKAIIESQVNKFSTMVEHGHPVEIADLAEKANQKSDEWTKKPKLKFDEKTNMQFKVGRCLDTKVEFGKVSILLHEPSVQKVKLQNKYIWDMICTSKDRLIVTGQDDSSVAIYDKDHKLEKDLKEKCNNVVRTKEDELAFTNMTNTIHILLPDGTHKRNLVCKGTNDLRGISINSAGEIVVGDRYSKAVFCVDASTGEAKQQSKAGMFMDPIYVACNSKDIAIISDIEGHFVKGINRDGTEVFTYGESGDGEGELYNPHGVCTDAEDYIFVADCSNQRVHMLDPHGRFMRYVLTEEDGVNQPHAVTIDHDGNLLVGDTNGNLFIVKYRG